jgi:hypothetical protein
MENTATQQCPECHGTELYETVIDPNHGFGPPLLPALGSFMQGARLKLLLCRSCGLLRMYASQNAREKLPDSTPWSRVEPETSNSSPLS